MSYASENPEPRVFDMDCGEGVNTVMPPESICSALRSMTPEMVSLYPHGTRLKEAIGAFWKGRADLSPGRLTPTDGSIAGLYLVNRLFLEPGDSVAGLSTLFFEYAEDVRLRGCDFCGVPLRRERNWRFDADEFMNALRPGCKLAYLDNPNNPTGQILPLGDLERILRRARSMDICLLVDEAYGEYMPEEASALNLFDRYENLLVVRSFSKGFGLAGLRAGYLAAREELTRAAGILYNPYACSSLSRLVAEAVLKESDFLAELRRSNAAVKKQLLRPWKRLSMAHTAETLSICMIAHSDPGLDLAEAFAERGVKVISCAGMEGAGKNSVRLRLPAAGSMPRLLEVMEQIDRLS